MPNATISSISHCKTMVVIGIPPNLIGYLVIQFKLLEVTDFVFINH